MIWSKGGIEMEVRDGTSDWNTVEACIGEDEYGLGRENVAGKLVFDIGSHVGSVGIWCASAGATAVCVEPIPDNLDLIWKNVVRNELEGRVRIVPGVAGAPGERVVRWGFAQDETARHHAFIGDSGLAAPDVPFLSKTVRSYSLWELIDLYGAPDIIKLDCEGGEWPWLTEPEILKVPLIVGEWHPVEGWMRADVVSALGMTHVLSFSGPEAGPGGFRAELRT